MSDKKKAVVKRKPVIQLKTPPNKFIYDLAVMFYYEEHGTLVGFSVLPEEEQKQWFVRAIAVVTALDKMNQRIAPKEVEQPGKLSDEEALERLRTIIEQFLEGITTVKCPKCGGDTDLKIKLFPCQELAHRIWSGKVV